MRILESQARKNKEKGRISRTDKGVSGKQMTEELGKLGLPVDVSGEVSLSEPTNNRPLMRHREVVLGKMITHPFSTSGDKHAL